MTDSFITFTIWASVITIGLWAVTFTIPYIGFSRKRYKGLFLGCLIQPIVCIAIALVAIMSGLYYMASTVKEQRKAAMVTFCKAENDTTDTKAFYYVKPDDECFTEHGVGKNDKEVFGYDHDNDIDVLDVFLIDSTSILVDDEFLLKFDLKNRMVTATDYEDTIEVANVDWEKVEAYFKEKKLK